MLTKKIIVWFRQDLRITDNPALSLAVDNGTIIPVFILDDDAPEQAILGGASKWWLHHSLLSLNNSLSNKLLIRRGNPLAILTELAETFSADSVVWNRLYEPWQRERDENIKLELKKRGIKAKSLNGSLLWEPMTVLKKDETPYKVFTPYYRKGCLTRQAPRFPLAKPKNMHIADDVIFSLVQLKSLELIPKIEWYK
jgi:deoxyribodipyrimidine photo-lyase